MTHRDALRNSNSPVLVLELAEGPNFARSVLTQTSYELQGDLNGKK
jgi:hypothetical protein